ncbi:MAG: 16S rRNA (uracil(1498)-N(3))-methyltransferase [Clostridia bacterium]|nr:16S rRNA (uracil(1498)-N(3))-methyltransferase [Clostridia bacterium]
MYKFFVENGQIKDEMVTIIGEDVNHIRNVLRLKIEKQVQICNKDTSKSYVARILELEPNEVRLEIIEECVETSESKILLDIFQGLPKQEKMEQIIKQATEIGVSAVIPVKMERCVVKLDDKAELKKVERWQKIAEVASKQSKRDKIPKVHSIISLKNVYEKLLEYDIVVIAYEEENETTIKQVLQELNHEMLKKVAVVIGSEGGLDFHEVDFLRKLPNAKIVTLGKRILRTETAPLVLASVIMYEFNEMQ